MPVCQHDPSLKQVCDFINNSVDIEPLKSKEAKILGEIERLHQQFSGHTYGEANNIATYTNCITLDVYANLLVCLQISDNTKNLKFKLSRNADVWFRF